MKQEYEALANAIARETGGTVLQDHDLAVEVEGIRITMFGCGGSGTPKRYSFSAWLADKELEQYRRDIGETTRIGEISVDAKRLPEEIARDVNRRLLGPAMQAKEAIYQRAAPILQFRAKTKRHLENMAHIIGGELNEMHPRGYRAQVEREKVTVNIEDSSYTEEERGDIEIRCPRNIMEPLCHAIRQWLDTNAPV